MGNTHSTTATNSNMTQTQTTQATPEEQQLNKSLLDQQQQLMPLSTESYKSAFGLIQALLSGSALPGGYGQSDFNGIDQNGRDAIVSESLRGIPPALQAAGMIDSGAGQAMYARGAQNVLSNVAQFNVQNRNNLMQMGLTGSMGNQAAVQGGTAQLSQNLAGLRPVTTTGQASGTSVFTHNPFLESFYSSLGSGFGQGIAGGTGGAMSGGFGKGWTGALAGG